MHVLILGARAPACLEWARSFAESGARVTVADSLGQPLSRFSRSVHRFVRLPEPRENPAHWIDALVQVITLQQVDLLLPTCEEVFYLAHGLEQLAPLCRVLTSDFDLLHRLHHKGHFASMTQDWRVKTPKTHVLLDQESLLAFTKQSEQWVFKPAYSRFASRTLIRPAPRQLSRIQPSIREPWVAQQFVDGRELCSFSVLVDGEVRAHACYHPRYRVGRGSGIYFQPETPAAVLDCVEQFGKATRYTGQVGFDFIEDGTGRFHVLECNPRATSGVHLFSTQRQQLVECLQKGSRPLLHAGSEPHMIALAMLLLATPAHGLKLSFWRDLRAARDAILVPGDARPLTAQLLSLSEIIGRALSRRCGLLAASTADIEWNGQPLGDLPQ